MYTINSSYRYTTTPGAEHQGDDSRNAVLHEQEHLQPIYNRYNRTHIESIVIVVLVDLQSSYSYINIRVISTNSFGEFCFSCEGHSHSDRFVFVHLLHSKTGKKHTSWIWSTVYPINIQHVCESLKQAY